GYFFKPIMSVAEFADSALNDARAWCRGKNWFVRLPLLFWFFYLLLRHLSNPGYGSVLSFLNLGIHELGHPVFSILGNFLGMAGGTIAQLAVPVAGIFNFYRQRDYFAIAACFGWLSTSFFDVARYASDARAMELPLVNPFGAEIVIHDWNYMLGKLGLLNFDTAIGFFFKGLAVLSMSACLGFGGWLLWRMFSASRAPEQETL
ncbi:MAG: hypothetical protein PHN57_06290, partial [Candidatus Omnitrophica bacterium]|nr:hypothetical protein [Candidatus Omnitrophota bacterium]